MLRITSIRVVVVATLMGLGFLSLSPPAGAQYFGRNKVQYKSFHFEVLKTDHFDVYFYPEEQEAASSAARMAERWYTRLSRLLDHELHGRQPIVLYASHADFEQTNTLPGFIEEGTGGVTEGLKRRVVLPLAGTLAETDHVLGHELVHAFQYDMAAATERGLAAMDQLPLWLVEGMAEYLSIGPVDPHTAMWIRDASREEDGLPDIDHLDDPELFPYRWGQALWAYLAGQWGDDVVGRIFQEGLNVGSGPRAIENVVGMKIDDVSSAWHEAIHTQYAGILETTSPAESYGPTLSEGDRPGSINVSPALSPDGTEIVYFSERSLLSVDLYLADVASGRVIRRLASTSLNPHFTSLQFIGSAGSWRPDGTQFVLGTIRKGQADLAIIDVETGDLVRDIPFPSLGEILNPSWSRDGRFIVFSATHGGISDLFIYDLQEASLRQVTDDAFADLQPVWSPDGRRVAFVTDRFSTDLASLRAGTYGLALLDPTTNEINDLTTFASGKNISPQWAPDSRRLYFLSDRNGLTNVYVIDTTTGSPSQVTNLNTGVSGITALSPALSLAADASLLAFSAYDHGKTGIYVVQNTGVLGGGPVQQLETDSRADVLPPQQRVSDELESLLADASTGLPDEPGQTEPYHAHLSLDSVGQPYVGVGVSSFGPTFGGGITLTWSDMLGNHNLLAAVDANTYGTGFGDLAKNTGGLVAYQNVTHRWNWGVAAQQSPYIAAGFATGVTTSNGQPVYIEQDITQRQTYRSASGIVSYPFNQVRRVDFSSGYANVSFDEQVRTILTSLQTGRVVSDQTTTTPLSDPLHLLITSVSAVSDSATFGATSPVAGERSHFELSPTVGTISFSSAIADYRRYFMPASFYTVAARVLHAGRYGSGGEDPRLLPLFIGYPELVRGYTVGSFTGSECTSAPGTSCQEFDRLLGSRMLVGNLELRFPLLRPFGVRSGMYGPLPIEVAVFTDGGVAWNSRERPSFLGGDRKGVVSSGLTFRVNLFGFAVGQMDLVKPYQRPSRGWLWEFSLTPGY